MPAFLPLVHQNKIASNHSLQPFLITSHDSQWMLCSRDTWFKSFISTLAILTDVLHGFEYSFQEKFHKSQLLYFVSLNHSQLILYDPVLPVLPTLQVNNNPTGKQIIGGQVLLSGEYNYTANSNYQISTESQQKQFNNLEAERQSAASRINKKMARKIQACDTELRKVQKAGYQVQARLKHVGKQRGRK